MRPRIQVTALGMGASVQDLGRTGWLRYGVPMGGAMDRTAYLQANQLLGNAPNAPCIEFLHVGACVLIEAAGWFALAGAADGGSSRQERLNTWLRDLSCVCSHIVGGCGPTWLLRVALRRPVGLGVPLRIHAVLWDKNCVQSDLHSSFSAASVFDGTRCTTSNVASK